MREKNYRPVGRDGGAEHVVKILNGRGAGDYKSRVIKKEGSFRFAMIFDSLPSAKRKQDDSRGADNASVAMNDPRKFIDKIKSDPHESRKLHFHYGTGTRKRHAKPDSDDAGFIKRRVKNFFWNLIRSFRQNFFKRKIFMKNMALPIGTLFPDESFFCRQVLS